MDFYIPGVALEQIRAAGLRLQRGGVGFYPTSGSPFVHLDTGSIRHWPRMTHDQLAKVFPDGRTVHRPDRRLPLKGYELAKADIETPRQWRRAASVGKPSFLASLFKGKAAASDEDDEGAAAAPVKNEKPVRPPSSPLPPSPPQPRRAAARQARRCDPAARLRRRADRRSRRRRSRPGRARRREVRAEPSRRPRPTSSTPAASGTTSPRRRSRRRPPRSPPSTPARRSPPPIRKPTASVSGALIRRWPTRRRRLSGRSRQRRRRLRADPAQPRPPRRRATRWPSTRSTPWSPRARRGKASVIATAARLAAAKGATSIWMRVDDAGAEREPRRCR